MGAVVLALPHHADDDALLPSLRHMNFMCTLVLHGCGLTAAGIRPIVRAMRAGWGCSLRTIDVSCNQLGDAGVTMLAEKLPATLAKLSINCTECGDSGVCALANVLPQTCLVTFEANFNQKIGSQGAKALALAFPRLLKLTEVSLSGCPVGCDGATALAECLPRAASLHKLLMNNCGCGDAGATALAAHVAQSKLDELILGKRGYTTFSDAVLNAFAAAVATARPRTLHVDILCTVTSDFTFFDGLGPDYTESVIEDRYLCDLDE